MQDFGADAEACGDGEEGEVDAAAAGGLEDPVEGQLRVGVSAWGMSRVDMVVRHQGGGRQVRSCRMWTPRRSVSRLWGMVSVALGGSVVDIPSA